METIRIAATVILYNPTLEIISNAKSYANYVDKVIAVDNSEGSCNAIVQSFRGFENSVFISNGDNLGIANALNTAAQIAYQEGYQWLLTMDQDSSFDKTQIANFLHLPTGYGQGVDTVGIFTPYHATQTAGLSNYNSDKLSVVKTCMTSGNLINLEIWRQVGGFNDSLFIDYVDHEYCLKIRKQGYVVLQDNTTILKHQLGEAERIKFANVSYTTSNHNYIRRYYITRNRLYFIKKYFLFDPKLCISEAYSLCAESVKILLQEKQRLKKFKSIARGIKDFLTGSYGPYRYF
ncbi:glycosyltransferase family 2 protein [Mucilaginibacter sp. CSA2-8R]|uniref:glycosyltransferase family 2 protein n=1 Tax=Mucilaginibacter sp. CSA2-8R TaxID=3141542 RepID=UPI00315DF6B4